MGNSVSVPAPVLELLGNSIEELEGRLFWPCQPYEGPVKLRFCCDRCKYDISSCVACFSNSIILGENIIYREKIPKGQQLTTPAFPIFDAYSQEAVLLQPYPEKWSDLVGVRGECFACGSVQRVCTSAASCLHALLCVAGVLHRRQIRTKFIEAGTREPIWVFNGRDERVLAQQIQKFIVCVRKSDTVVMCVDFLLAAERSTISQVVRIGFTDPL